MSSLLQLVSRVRAWRAWRFLRRPLAAPIAHPSFLVTASRPILRDVSAHGVRVYALCDSCGTHLGASATLCDACARARPMRNA